MSTVDTARYTVIGAGLMGAATAWQLAVRGEEVLVVERDEPANAQGSSHGSARIFRHAYPDQLYADLTVQACDYWDRLKINSGRTLIDRVGCLDHGRGRDPGQLAGVLERAGVEHALLSAGEASERWPGIEFSTPVLHQPHAGVIDAQEAVASMIDLAVAAGARVLTSWPASGVERAGLGFRVSGPAGGTIETSHVVVAAGGWLPGLLARLPLPAGAAEAVPPLTVMQENAYHFPYRDPQQLWPSLIHKDEMQVYSLPGGRDAGFRGQKLAEYNGGRALGSAALQDGIIDPANRERVIEYVRRNLPGLVPEPYAETTCLFTNTPDEHFVLDTLDDITLVSPCSGHGAKFAPLIGALAADLATGSTEDGDSPLVPEVFRVFNQDHDADPAGRSMPVSGTVRVA
ncbi:FAD-dependent oxidoreductase [Citricoccus muralis]|uniref:Glycine/D-amino acid oxidase-like deaminating enzyme n=1 Tax=Citricoccus muralis TaxID=169134 RepID=A0A3D9LCN7_9MICC|nr:glycine/D-amino acid oxidase-like deaminating enzyme [Citricoccus muralis]